MSTILAKLPVEMREDLKAPLGPIYTDTDELLAEAGEPIVAVGDIVTYHLLEADRRPDVAIVDGKTKRERVEREVLDAIDGFDDRIDVVNPQSTITDDLLEALASAVGRSASTVIVVDGEEDLAAIPAVLAVPEGGSIVYGQPDEGMVLVSISDETRARCRDLLERMESDYERIAEILAP
ncbi:MAG: GTP-dependent dephospho-CoA kinase family protein [Natronomonas sp.]|uniref:GTP-dependent dephospho-CoA kinase family protein n=1 Tax=Natronomonas sp. TaxID=2184060 RepID=UPI002870A099|nr:GTP-dependent dephospho-CoA kinase family protein [Natronomonas sp.]MDR9380754.1 GTP-dependent dephospho-CoA kinase family protein [Natronomonas sp.]MDR9430954.1 GTP-dependent dephospho-CoA kinase family protein [Natronomonas sp.]